MKRNILYNLLGILILIIIGLLIFKFTNKEEDTKDLQKISVAEVTHSIFYTPFYVAIENGYFESEGIQIDLILVSGSDNVAASVLSGDTEVGLAGPESAIFVYLGKEKNYLQVFSGLTKRDGQFIIARSDEEFNWNNLIGKEILVGRSTGMPALSFLKALENKGIDKSKLNINYSVDFAELSGTFLSGVGDYVNLFEPIATKLEDNKSGYVVESVGQISEEFPYTAFYARKNYIDENKEILEGFARAIKKGMDFTYENDGLTTAKVIKNQFSDTDIETLSTMIERYKDADAWLKTPYVEEEFYNTIVDLLKDNDLIDSPIYYNDMVNNLYE